MLGITQSVGLNGNILSSMLFCYLTSAFITVLPIVEVEKSCHTHIVDPVTQSPSQNCNLRAANFRRRSGLAGKYPWMTSSQN